MRRLAVAAVATCIAMAACGGKIDSTSSSSSSGSGRTTPTVPGTSVPPSTGSSPGSPANFGAEAQSIAERIAKSYCSSFSSCCKKIGQPPIDLARCLDVTISLLAPRSQLTMQLLHAVPGTVEIERCVSAIETRTGVCADEDANFGFDADAFAGPSSVREACTGVLGPPSKPTLACAESHTCNDGNVCAIDECVVAGALGESCAAQPCLDSLTCVGGGCHGRVDMPAGALCDDGECRAGLVCFGGTCSPNRLHPAEHTITFSPYRVGGDTCGAYENL